LATFSRSLFKNKIISKCEICDYEKDDKFSPPLCFVVGSGIRDPGSAMDKNSGSGIKNSGSATLGTFLLLICSDFITC